MKEYTVHYTVTLRGRMTFRADNAEDAAQTLRESDWGEVLGNADEDSDVEIDDIVEKN